MRFISKSHLLMLSVLILLMLVISACSSNDKSDTSSDDSSDDKAESSEVTVEGAKGKVTIPSNVERIIAPFHEDALLALGVTPVAQWSIGKSVQEYLQPQLEDIPRLEWNLPLEQVLDHNPELIILESDLAGYEGSYENYKNIATTYVMPDDISNDWRKQIEIFGKILGKQNKAEEVQNQYEEKVAKAKEKLSNSIGDETVAAIWVTGDKFFLFEKNRHSAEVIYSELGIEQPEFVKSLGEAKAEWNPISMEKLAELQADHIFLLATEGEQGIETLKNSDVWQSIPAAENDHVYIMNDPSPWTNKGLIASKKTIDALVDTLTK